MGLFFKFDQAVPERVPKKGDFFRQDLGETYISGMAPKRRILMGFFTIFWEKTLITLSKVT